MSQDNSTQMDPRDAAFLQMLGGASFGGDVTLPSGKRYSGAEVTALAGAHAPDAGRSTALGFVRWLISMDDPADARGTEERRVVTLNSIIQRAREVEAALLAGGGR